MGDVLPSPDVPEHLFWVWRAWHRLHLDRPWTAGGMGPAMPRSIPWRDVRDWCEFHDLPGTDVPFLDACVREMDAEFFEWHRMQTSTGARGE